MLCDKILFVFLMVLVVSKQVLADDSRYWAERAGDLGQFAVPLTALSAIQFNVYKQTNLSNSNGLVASTNNSSATQQLLYQYATTLSIVHTLKLSLNETRPNGGDHSFPSGHTASAFAGAAFIESNYGWKWGIPAYVAASFVGWSRVYAEKHWPHDVFAGAALAISVNRVFNRHYKPTRGTVTFAPSISAPTIGYQVSF